MYRKARFLITLDCHRSCDGCCNSYGKIMGYARNVSSLEELFDFDEIIITGGEPMLHGAETVKMIRNIKSMYPKKKIYLYTTLFNNYVLDILPILDGIHYTLHYPADELDNQLLLLFQEY